MKIRYLSDLHLEFIKPDKIYEFIKQIPSGINDEICVLAGDIGDPYKSHYTIFMEFINSNFKKSFVILGNHEYYNKSIKETNDFTRKMFEKFENISLLNNSYENYNNHCFIGTTLWSKITNPAFKINDVNKIKDFDYIAYNTLNAKAVHFLEDVVKTNTNCIVITHHLPSESLIDPKYKTVSMSKYNQWFYCNMDKLIAMSSLNIKCWFYGHTHTYSNRIINGIQFLCNPGGYPDENNDVNYKESVTLY